MARRFCLLNHRDDNSLLTIGIQLILKLLCLKVHDDNNRPCQVCLCHASGDLNGHIQAEDLEDHPILDEDHCVNNLGDYAQLDSPNKPLNGINRGSCMDNTSK